MGIWPKALFFLLLVVATRAKAVDNEQEDGKPCIAWHCQRRDKRFAQPSGDVKGESEVRSRETKPCISWECRREMLLRKFLSEERVAESTVKKSSGMSIPEETPCLSWECRRKRRSVSLTPQSETPQADVKPCLTRDCRTGKRSLVPDGTAPLDNPQINVRAIKRRSARKCLTWICNRHGG